MSVLEVGRRVFVTTLGKALVLGQTAIAPTPVPTPNPTPTPQPTPVNGAILTTFGLTNWGTTTSKGFFRQGIVFQDGQVPAGSSVQVQFGGNPIAVQFNERHSFPSGCLGLAIMHGRDADFPAGASRSYMVRLVLGAPFSDVAGTTPDQIAAGHDFHMQFANHTSQDSSTTTPVGSGTSTASLAAHMAVTTRREMHHVGAVCDGATCWGMAQDASSGTVDAHLKTVWHVDKWKNADGSIYSVEIGCEPQQNSWSVPGKTRRNYDATLLDGATTIASYPGVPHIYNTHWATVQNAGGNNRGRRHWIGGACPTLTYQPDRAHWIKAGFIPALNLSTPHTPIASPGGYSGNATYIPISSQEHRPGIDATGAYAGRGVIPNPDALAFLSQNPSDVAATRINAMAGLHVPNHHRSNRQRTRPGEAADTANTVIAFDMSGPAGLPAFDFTVQGMPVPVLASVDNRASDSDGYVRPSGPDVYWGVSYGDTGQAGTTNRADDASHAVNYSYFMYLLEGERYHLEATCDLAMCTLHQGTTDMYHPPLVWDYAGTRWGGVAQFFAQGRATGLAQNLIGSAAGIIPDAHVASGHFRRLVHQQGAYYAATVAGLPPDWALSGTHPNDDGNGQMTPFFIAFCALGSYHSWRLNGEAGLKAWADYSAQWSLNQIRDRIDVIDTYRAWNKRLDTAHDIRFNPYVTLALDVDAPIATIAASTGVLTGGYLSPSQNGDILYPTHIDEGGASHAIPPELTPGVPYYAVNVSAPNSVFGSTFQLATTPGGAPISFAADRTDAHFLHDYPPGGANADAARNQSIHADDYPPIHRAVVVDAYRAHHPAATGALVARAQAFNSIIPADDLAGWATWDYTVPADEWNGTVAATSPPGAVPNLRTTYLAVDMLWVAWDMPSGSGQHPVFKVEVSGDGGATYTVVNASTPNLGCRVSPGASAPRAQIVRVTAINEAGPSTTPSTLAVTLNTVQPAGYYSFTGVSFGDSNGNFGVTIAVASTGAIVSKDVLLGLSSSSSAPPPASAYHGACC